MAVGVIIVELWLCTSSMDVRRSKLLFYVWRKRMVVLWLHGWKL